MSKPPQGASPYDMHEWARLQTRKHQLKPREGHLLLVLIGYADRHTLKCYPAIPTLARDCGLKVSTYEFAAQDRGPREKRTASRNSTISAALKRLEALDLIRICPRGQGLSNYYYVHFTKPARADLVKHGMRRADDVDVEPQHARPDPTLEYDQPDSSPVLEYDEPDSRSTTSRTGTCHQNVLPDSTGQQEPARARSTASRTPESPASHTPQHDDNDRELTPGQIRALIADSAFGRAAAGRASERDSPEERVAA